jgi:thiamine biosynthesis lipoprotein
MALHRFSFRAMAAGNEVQIHADDARSARRAAARAIAEVRRIEAKYSRYRAGSLLSRINAAAGGKAVAVDPETDALLDYADACWRESGGLFDVTSGVLRAAWDFRLARVPTDGELEPLVARIGWGRVEREAGRVRLPEAGMEIDFGGLGKEYAVDRAIAELHACGVASALVNLAGDMAILGPQPGGAPWRVGLRHPRREGEIAATWQVASGAIATSGDYERFVEVEGVRHCHVLDPRSGRSVQGFRSVTVHAPSCLVAGSASTIALLKGDSEGLGWLTSLGLPFHAILGDGRVAGNFGGGAERAC